MNNEYPKDFLDEDNKSTLFFSSAQVVVNTKHINTGERSACTSKLKRTLDTLPTVALASLSSTATKC